MFNNQIELSQSESFNIVVIMAAFQIHNCHRLIDPCYEFGRPAVTLPSRPLDAFHTFDRASADLNLAVPESVGVRASGEERSMTTR